MSRSAADLVNDQLTDAIWNAFEFTEHTPETIHKLAEAVYVDSRKGRIDDEVQGG